MAVADFFIKLGLNTSPFTQGTNKAKADLQSLDGAIRKISSIKADLLGVVAGTAIGGLLLKGFSAAEAKLDELIQKAKEIRVGSIRTGMDTQKFQQVSNVFDSKGSSIEKYESSSEHLNDAQQKILDGEDEGAKLQRSFARLGVTMEDLKKKNFQQVWFEIAENMRYAEITGEKLAAMKDIFGKNPDELIPVFKEGFEGKIANRATLSDKELKDVNEYGAAKKDFAAIGSMIGLEAAKAWMNANAFQIVAARLLFRLGSPRGPNEERMSKRLVDEKTEKAEAQAQIAGNAKDEKKKRDDLKKRAEEIAKKMAEAEKDAAKEQVESASPRDRAVILRQRNEALDRRINHLSDKIRLGDDEDGSAALERQQLLNQRSENRRGIRDAMKGTQQALRAEKGDQLSRLGLYVGGHNPVQLAVNEQTRILQRELSELQYMRREIANLRRDINR
jgi:hypothetical protein